MQKLDALLKQAGDLSSLPEVYIRVNELLDTDNATAIQIGDALQTDPALTARILKPINSGYYGLLNPVTSILQAVTLLVLKYLQQALTGSALAEVFKDFNINEFPLRDFWQHSIKTAIIARQLAMQNTRLIDHEAFFTAGLLHDIGWLVVAKVIPNAYMTVSEIAQTEQRDIIVVETEKLGVTHIDVGVALREKQGIPGLIIQCVKMHHETDHSGPMAIETSIVAMANQLSRHSLPDEEEEDSFLFNTNL